MAGLVDVIINDEEIRKAFNAMSQKVRNKALRPAVRKVMKRVAADAKSRVPVVTGTLKKSIKADVQRSKFDHEIYGRVKAYTPYAHLVEYGFTRKLVSGGTKHYAAKAFLNPAMDARREDALREINSEIEKLWKEVGGR